MDLETILCTSAPLQYFISEISCPTIFISRLQDLVWTWMKARTQCQGFFVEMEEVSISSVLAIIQVWIPGPPISLCICPTQATSRCHWWQLFFTQWAVWGLGCWWASQKHSLQLSYDWKLCSSAPKQLASLVPHSCGNHGVISVLQAKVGGNSGEWDTKVQDSCLSPLGAEPKVGGMGEQWKSWLCSLRITRNICVFWVASATIVTTFKDASWLYKSCYREAFWGPGGSF